MDGLSGKLGAPQFGIEGVLALGDVAHTKPGLSLVPVCGPDAADHRRRHRLGPVAPHDHLGYDVNFLCMTFGKVSHPNLYYPAGLACRLIGFDAPDFAPTLVAARLPGWTAHPADQLAASSVIQHCSVRDQAGRCRAGER
jgi:citrate synthase